MGRWIRVGLGSAAGLAMIAGEMHDWTVPDDVLDVSAYVNASPAATGIVSSTTSGAVVTSITIGPWDDSTGLQSVPYHLLVAAERTAPPAAITPAPDPVPSEETHPETVWFAAPNPHAADDTHPGPSSFTVIDPSPT